MAGFKIKSAAELESIVRRLKHRAAAAPRTPAAAQPGGRAGVPTAPAPGVPRVTFPAQPTRPQVAPAQRRAAITARAVSKGIPAAEAQRIASAAVPEAPAAAPATGARPLTPLGVYPVQRPAATRPQVYVHDFPEEPAKTAATEAAPSDANNRYRWAEVLTEKEYQAAFGVPRDVSPRAAPPATTEGAPESRDIRVIFGPNPLNHEGHLRRTGKVCGHWAMYAYLVGGPDGTYLGVQFNSGFRCYYPDTNEDDYHACLNAESGSYWCWDNGIHPHGRGYIRF
jgi:hypothetical protein